MECTYVSLLTFLLQMLLSKIEGTTPRLLDLTTLPELNETRKTNNMITIIHVGFHIGPYIKPKH